MIRTMRCRRVARPSLDRNQIKYIAVIAMLIDHVAVFFLAPGIAEASTARIALYAAMRVIGRLTGPIMIFFLVEGFIHTSSRRKYGARLFVFGLLSQIPYVLSHYNKLFAADFNVIITLFILFLMLTAVEKINNGFLNRAVVLALIAVTYWCDWGVIGPLMAWVFYQYHEDRKMQIQYYAAVCMIQLVSAATVLSMKGLHWYGELWQAGLFLVIPFLIWYNGRPGSRSAFSRWIFYIVYPLHLLIIWLITASGVHL